MNTSRRILIPAAGYGTRMGSPEAKELLIDPETAEPMINYSLKIARELEVTPLVISRKDKTSLNSYIYSLSDVELFEISSSKEWPDTLLKSQGQWADYNLMLLPDTRFFPPSAPAKMFELLESKSELVFATFSEDRLETWGALGFDHNSKQCFICEKPQSIPPNFKTLAWGILGFNKRQGLALLNALLLSGGAHSWEPLSVWPEVLELKWFRDISRPVRRA